MRPLLFASRSTARAGMTLVELIVVIVIVGVLATAGTTAVFYWVDFAKNQKAQTDLKQIRDAVLSFETINSRYPSDLVELTQRSEEGAPPSLKTEDLQDPWGQPYLYEEQETSFLVTSSGPDKTPGTEDDLQEVGGDAE